MAVAAVVALAVIWQQQRHAAGNVPVQNHRNTFSLTGKVDRVSDGDTFTFFVNNRRETIRMASIDAPETTKDAQRPGQPMSQASRKALQALIEGKAFTLTCYERDHYERAICDVPLDSTGTANQRMVSQGLAWANMEGQGKFMRDPSMQGLEKAAKDKKIGIWGQPNPVAPWQWRYQCWKQSQC